MKDRYAKMEEALVGTGESRSERQAQELAELKRQPTETQLQNQLLQALELQRGRYPEIGLMFAIPNSGGLKGGFKSNARLVMKNKRMGVKKGVPDLFLPVPRGLFHGLFIEMKAPDGSIKREQLSWHNALRGMGYMVVVVNAVQTGLEIVLSYLDYSKPSPLNARTGQPGRAP